LQPNQFNQRKAPELSGAFLRLDVVVKRARVGEEVADGFVPEVGQDDKSGAGAKARPTLWWFSLVRVTGYTFAGRISF
jgi:hypothetical protein